MAARIDWDEIAGVLLEKRFYLTALELHTELLEGGKENRKLGDFFSNPGNFESATPSSLARPAPSNDLCELLAQLRQSTVLVAWCVSTRPSLQEYRAAEALPLAARRSLQSAVRTRGC